MFDELVLPERAELRKERDGSSVLSLNLRLPWYRALPLSCVNELELAIDGTPIAPDDVTIGVGDGFHSLAEVQSLDNTWWFQLDTAEARIPNKNGVQPGEHTVAISLGLRIPYRADPSDEPEFTQTAEYTRSVRFEGGDL
ncbi:hypothetical protein FHX82_007319 [Amycolatopsis bartoniae]|uniref:C-deglycosylation enzyme beta subunit n=1 Tax=Amycolatopsis bartoniae TaxID=941986 RepID=A0A8H9IPT9_9PSEU|nr:DUF6379 domain-containing protein [Amycolatopsis bartoniae]MBB2940232.1 hypothetical protein [Amycolatopsis bartoniae]TVT10189.1 hypothetical protein FNH07_06340 [Amycolatopsis bartoniae]GHF35015.1 hypothetical protein GCM10017566_04660 [Amycolatopsis bartoniae]